MKLIDDIIAGVIDNREPIADVLRRCLVLAYKLKNDALKTWVEKELNGYQWTEPLPEYRKSSGVAKGHFLGSFSRVLHDQPLAAAVLKPEHRHWATEIRLIQPVAAYETSDKLTNGTFPWPADLVVRYQSKFIEDFALNRAWLEVPASTMIGLVDTVRTRILTFALQIQDEIGNEDEAHSVEKLPSAVIERIVNVTIYGGQNVIGSVDEINAPTVIAGDPRSLQAALSALGLSDAAIAELEGSIHEDRSLASNDQLAQPGKKTLEWISEAAVAVGTSGLKIGGAVAEEALRRIVFRYLGL
ncbi:MAG TPA: hypothetical protein VGG27_13370 [Magnetospirillaceae bacterium]